jgi:hypothetical protein
MKVFIELGIMILISIIITIIYGIAFSLEYPLVKIDTSLAFLLMICGIFTYIIARSLFELPNRKQGTKSLLTRIFGFAGAIPQLVHGVEAPPKSPRGAKYFREVEAAADVEIGDTVKKLSEVKPSSSTAHVTTTMTGGAAGVVGAHNVYIGGPLNVGTPAVKEPPLFGLTIDGIRFDNNRSSEIYVDFYIANPGKATIVRNWLLEAYSPEGMRFSARPRDVFTGGVQELIDIGKVFFRPEDLSVTPLQEGGARRGYATYSHAGPSTPFQKPGTTFRSSAHDVLGRVVVAKYSVGEQ